ncbi:MAG: hypothetical protein WBE26_06580 [Phycisphaerae bacterium]
MIPLGGGDYFVLALDHLMRRMGLEGNICRLAVQVLQPLDRDRFASALRRSTLIGWLSSLRLSARLPFFPPIWVAHGSKARPIVRDHVDSRPGSLSEALSSIASARRSRTAPSPHLAFDLVDHLDGSSSIILTWHHALMDALGAELLLSHLNGCADIDPVCVPACACTHADRQRTGRRIDENLPALIQPHSGQSVPRYLLRFPRNFLSTRRAVLFITKTSRFPIASLVGSSIGVIRPCNRYRFVSFDESKTVEVDAHADRIGASFHRGLFYLASTIRAFDRVRATRGLNGDAYVIPIPQDRRKRGASGPILSNRITFQFYRVEPQQTGLLTDTYETLKQQMVDQMRADIPGSYNTLMELFRNVPLGWYARVLRGPTKGQLSTFFYSYTGEVGAGMDHFLGAPVKALRHLPPVAQPPGVAVVFSRHRNRLHATLTYLEGCLSDAEVALFEETLRFQLLVGDKS